MIGFMPTILLLFLLPQMSLTVAWFSACILLNIMKGIAFFRKEPATCRPALQTSLIILALLLPALWFQESITPLVGIGATEMAILIAVFISRAIHHPKEEKGSYETNPHKRLVFLEYQQIRRSILWISLVTIIFIGGYIYMIGSVIPTFFLYIPGVMIALLYFYEVIRLEWVRRKMLQEEWLPITDKQGKAIGRVARSETKEMKNPPVGLLPVVRLIAISDEMLYLYRYSECDLCQKECFDTPFFCWLTAGKNHADVAQALIDERFCGINRLRPHFLLRYVHNENGEDRLVYLYLAQMSEPNMILCDKDPKVGKWWPVSQIEEQLSGFTFSPYLRSEMPYLRQTVLLAEQIKNNHE